MAALSAAEAGCSTTLLERDLEGSSHAANTLFEGMAARAGIAVEESYVIRALDGMRIVSPSGFAATIPGKGYFIDRKRFDEHYLRLAEGAGVSILDGEALRSKLDGSRRTVACTGGEIDARVVIDASGIRSFLAQESDLRPMRHPGDIAWAMEAEVEYPALGDENLFSYWIGSMAPGWKATFSPAGGDRATLGVFVRGHGQNVQSFFRSFLGRFKSEKAKEYRNIEEMKILSVRRGGDPICVLPGEITADSLMVTGGAAGQSGLVYGMRAGTICGAVAARAVAEGDVSAESLVEYEARWRSEFYWEYRLGRSALLTLSGMKDGDVDLLVRGLSGKALISGDSFLKKAAFSGARVAMVQPKTVFGLLRNLLRG